MSQIELILSRHGETEENKLHIMQGQLPGHLSELGKQQAKEPPSINELRKINIQLGCKRFRFLQQRM